MTHATTVLMPAGAGVAEGAAGTGTGVGAAAAAAADMIRSEYLVVRTSTAHVEFGAVAGAQVGTDCCAGKRKRGRISERGSYP
jgi:hypothetical protein